jgi:hypothetical protein
MQPYPSHTLLICYLEHHNSSEDKEGGSADCHLAGRALARRGASWVRGRGCGWLDRSTSRGITGGSSRSSGVVAAVARGSRGQCGSVRCGGGDIARGQPLKVRTGNAGLVG